MKRELLLVFVAALALYLPAAGYGFVQDDRAIIVSNPAAHSIPAAQVQRERRDEYEKQLALHGSRARRESATLESPRARAASAWVR